MSSAGSEGGKRRGISHPPVAVAGFRYAVNLVLVDLVAMIAVLFWSRNQYIGRWITHAQGTPLHE